MIVSTHDILFGRRRSRTDYCIMRRNSLYLHNITIVDTYVLLAIYYYIRMHYIYILVLLIVKKYIICQNLQIIRVIAFNRTHILWKHILVSKKIIIYNCVHSACTKMKIINYYNMHHSKSRWLRWKTRSCVVAEPRCSNIYIDSIRDDWHNYLELFFPGVGLW